MQISTTAKNTSGSAESIIIFLFFKTLLSPAASEYRNTKYEEIAKHIKYIKSANSEPYICKSAYPALCIPNIKSNAFAAAANKAEQIKKCFFGLLFTAIPKCLKAIAISTTMLNIFISAYSIAVISVLLSFRQSINALSRQTQPNRYFCRTGSSTPHRRTA